MTKSDSRLIHVGTHCWSMVTGLGKPYKVAAIVQSGPRKPYFILDGEPISYRDVTRCVNVPTCPPITKFKMSEADRLERKRRQSREQYARRKAAG